jgi:hypothetical protein
MYDVSHHSSIAISDVITYAVITSATYRVPDEYCSCGTVIPSECVAKHWPVDVAKCLPDVC